MEEEYELDDPLERINAIQAMEKLPGWEVFQRDMRKQFEAAATQSRLAVDPEAREVARLISIYIETNILDWMRVKQNKLRESLKKK